MSDPDYAIRIIVVASWFERGVDVALSSIHLLHAYGGCIGCLMAIQGGKFNVIRMSWVTDVTNKLF